MSADAARLSVGSLASASGAEFSATSIYTHSNPIRRHQIVELTYLASTLPQVRMMLAMSVRCGTCGNYMYKGTKFTMRMEDVVGEEYLGIRIFRYIVLLH